MRIRLLLVISLLMVSTSVGGCALITEEAENDGAGNPSETMVEQSVDLHPIFVLDGLSDLPTGVSLQELYLGVGALFFEPTAEAEFGIAYANRVPFSLHFRIEEGMTVAQAPMMVLPEGGRYQMSVQLEPLLVPDGSDEAIVHSLVGKSGAEASLIVNGTVIRSIRNPPDRDLMSEPAPLPWLPNPEQSEEDKQAKKSPSWAAIPFLYRTDRSVRFVLGEVDLDSGTSIELVMQVPVGSWVEESIYPAIDRALEFQEQLDEVDDSGVEENGLDLSDLLNRFGDGIDGLIGGIEVIVQ